MQPKSRQQKMAKMKCMALRKQAEALLQSEESISIFKICFGGVGGAKK